MRYFSRILELWGYALRLKPMLGRAGHQRREAKRLRSQFYEDVWREAAGELGAVVEGLGQGIFKIGCDSVSIRVHNNYTPLDSVTDDITLDKSLVHSILRSNGLPIPDHAEFSLNNLNKAYEFLAQHRICVVKPAEGTGAGGGVTTGIETRSQLIKAAARAAGYSPRLLIEEHLEGDIIRLLYLDGKLLDAVKRGPPTVLGDGRSRISQLVHNLNLRRLDAGYKVAQVTLKYDFDMERTLARQNLSWRSVPATGRRVTLKTVINDNMADENESVVDEISKSVIAAGRQAAELVGARLVGVDVITPDVHQGFDEAGTKILEINTAPGYYYHYFNRTGPCRVAVPILEACLKQARRLRGDIDYVRT
jgi:D-alanine-D-alanine ligase-like ATP-grasp enzyme